ncbi:sulfate transporter (plasmid) [Caballeronia cordobensis]|nr:sulfate transporter [Burkholderia sp. RPE67]
MIGRCKRGFVTELLSLPIRHGFLNGVIVSIIFGQLPKLLGYKGKGESFFEQLRDLIGGIAASKVNLTSFGIAMGAFALILLFKLVWPSSRRADRGDGAR